MKKKQLLNLIIVAGIIFIFYLSLHFFRGPKPISEESEPSNFSALRALKHVEVIASKPHSMGTDEHIRVRNYVYDQLKNMGLETSIQQTTVIDDRRNLRAASVYNVIGVLKGTNSSKAIMIVSHYDSTPHTLGAADDGASVAAMLEAIRAIKELGSFENDIIFLFTDGEESGLFGAKAFVREHELADEVGILLNLEARGSSGPAFTYEVSPQNGWIMREYFKAVSHPIASSFTYEIYKLMPNSSDFTVFKEADFSGYNTAFIEDFVNYHSMTDSPKNLDLRSLQHIGSYIIGVIEHFGNMEINDPKTSDLLYFNIIGDIIIFYPQSFSIFSLILVVILFFLVIILEFKKKHISIWKILLSVLIYAITMALASGAIWLLNNKIISAYPHYGIYYSINYYNILFYAVSYAAIGLAIFSFVYALLYKKMGIRNLIFGVIIVNLFAMIALYIYIPTAVYISLIPLLCILLAFIVCHFFKVTWERKPTTFTLIHIIGVIPIITFYTPNVKVLFLTFGLDFPFAGLGVWIILLGFLLIPMRFIFNMNRWALSMLALVIGIIALIGADHNSDYDKEHPLQSSIMYVYNHDSDSALWVSNVLETDEWNQQFFDHPKKGALTEIYPYARRIRLKSEAAKVNYPKPIVSVLSDSLFDAGRKLKFKIQSAIHAENFQLYIHKNEITSFTINDKLVTDSLFYIQPWQDYHIMSYFGWYEEGVEFTIVCNSSNPIELLIFEKKIGLPGQLIFEPMPDYIIPQVGYESYMSQIRSRVVL